MTADDRSAYMLGSSKAELERLERQARFYAPATEALFAAAGLAPGMRVLDIGTGAGDVSMLVARIVGPGGAVTGIERSPQAAALARARAAAAGLAQCRFEVSEIDAFETDERFDAIVGRLILIYLPDPAATIRKVSRLLKPGGAVAFQELYFGGTKGYPHSELLEKCASAIAAAFAQVHGDLDLGAKLFDAVVKAGLPDPAMTTWSTVVTRADPEGYYIMASLMRTLGPMLEQFGIMSAKELDIETLERRLLEEVSRLGHVCLWSPLIGAWSRVP